MTHSSAEQVQSIFNQIAPVYDQLNQWLSLGQHRAWKQMTVDWSAAQLGDHCLDLCCGSGDVAQLLAHRAGPSGSVIGLDFSVEQLAIARQRVQGVSIGSCIQWQEGDALALPFEANYFDAITMGYGLRNVVDIPKCLAELYRVLKPGAKAAILDFCHSDHPLVQQFQAFYLNQIVVPVAKMYGCESEYAYIQGSLDQFPTGAEQVNIAKSVGFNAPIYYLIVLGTMGVLVLEKS